MHPTPDKIYKIVPKTDWSKAVVSGVFFGSAADVSDGYIHFSTANQLRETAARHFSCQTGLLLVSVAAEKLGTALRYEPSRRGDYFPHLYAPLDLLSVLDVVALEEDGDGGHVIAEQF